MTKLNFISIKAKRGHLGLIGALIIFVILLLLAGGLSLSQPRKNDPGQPDDSKGGGNGLAYPDSRGKMVIGLDPHNVVEFQNNVGSLQIDENKLVKNFGTVSQTKICPNPNKKTDRALMAQYLARVYNGTKDSDILRLTQTQMETFIKGCEWIYVVPKGSLPKTLTKYFNSKERLANRDNNNPNAVMAHNDYSPFGGISNLTTNWSGDKNQAYLFQTQMIKGDGKTIQSKWWGNHLFTDPTRASLRRGMMNTPQNDSQFFHKMFGYGGIPPNKLFEVGILPIDSPFAPPGTIQGVLGLPNRCNEDFNKTCTPNKSGKFPKNAYSYFCPGSGMFLNSGKGGYMFNFVDGLLNCPANFYSNDVSKKSMAGYGGVANDPYSFLFSKRLENGLPDHEVGIAKLIIYLHRKAIIAPNAMKLLQERAAAIDTTSKSCKGSNPNKTCALSKSELAGVAKFFASRGYKNMSSIPKNKSTDDDWVKTLRKSPVASTTLRVRLPESTIFKRMEPEFSKGGLDFPGLLSPLDLSGPPKSIIGNARTACSQLAALMGVWKKPFGKPANYMDEFYSYGLMTTDGKPKKANCPFVDKRKYAMGWVNGRWYGYPPENKYSRQEPLAPPVPKRSENFEYPSDAWIDETGMDEDETGMDEVTGRRGRRNTPGRNRRRPPSKYPEEVYRGKTYMTTYNTNDPKKSVYPNNNSKTSTASHANYCAKNIGATFQDVNGDTGKFKGGGRFTKGGAKGVPGTREKEMNERWDGNWFKPTKDNPLVYYGMPDKDGKREVLYETWYGKPLEMNFNTALKLMGMMYSCDDTGWLEGYTEWPFGAQFAYAADLGPLKKAIGGSFLEQYNAGSLHYTCTATSLSNQALVSPAYDYEVLITIGDTSIQTLPCFCKNYMKSVNLLYDHGKYLTDYINPARGAIGGLMPPEAGREFNGINGLSNFTAAYTQKELETNTDIDRTKLIRTTAKGGCSQNIKKSGTSCFYASFDPTEPNMITKKTNELTPLYCKEDVPQKK